jgi:hypothetical protein
MAFGASAKTPKNTHIDVLEKLPVPRKTPRKRTFFDAALFDEHRKSKKTQSIRSRKGEQGTLDYDKIFSEAELSR